MSLKDACCKTCQQASACKLPNYRGDGNCDDENNNKDCGYDGGDCCAKTVKGGLVKKDFCKEVGLGTDGCDVAVFYCVCTICVLFASRLSARSHPF